MVRPPDGIVTAGVAGAWCAWTGVAVTARRGALAAVAEGERWGAAVTAERSWLAARLAEAGDTAVRVELRYRVGTGWLEAECALLGAVPARDETTAVAGAVALRARMTELAAHLRVEPIRDAATLHRWLRPVPEDAVADPARADLVEIRRRWPVVHTERLGERAAPERLPVPDPADAPAWTPLWESLAVHPRPVTLTIGLSPRRIPAATVDGLRRVARDHERLAAGGTGIRERRADPAAATVAARYRDAADRYAGRAFLMRIALLSPGPLPDTLGHLCAATVLGDAAYALARPLPGERDAAWRATASLEPFTWRGDDPGTAGTPLARLADAAEAGTLFHLSEPPPVTATPALGVLTAAHSTGPAAASRLDGAPAEAPQTGIAAESPSAIAAAPMAGGGPAGGVVIADAALADLVEQVRSLNARFGADLRRDAERDAVAWATLAGVRTLIRTRGQAASPSVYTLVPVKRHVTGSWELELRLYCEQPDAWHRLAGDLGCYRLTRTADWLRRAAPWLRAALTITRGAAGLALPVLGVAVPTLDGSVKADVELVNALLAELPDGVAVDTLTPHLGPDTATPAAHASTEADHRMLQSLLTELDPRRQWGGLSHTTLRDGRVAYLCPEHVRD